MAREIALPGLNIQFPISQMILSGEKTVETRTYPLPGKYKSKPILLIETPGNNKTFRTRASGIVVFGESFPYHSKKEFYADFNRHKVDESSIWAWKGKRKWGWPIERFIAFKIPVEISQKRGIVFTTKIQIALDSKLPSSWFSLSL